MRARAALLTALVVLPACARVNPAFGDDELSTDGADGTGGVTGPDVTSTLGTGSVGTTALTGDMTDASTSGAEETDSVPEPDVGSSDGPKTWLWLTPPVLGNWGSANDDLCIATLPQGAACSSQAIPIVGRTNRPIATLPDQWSFLSAGPLFAASTGVRVVERFDGLVDGAVDPGFVTELTFPEDADQLFLWSGPVGRDGSPNCDNWSSTFEGGSIAFFQAGSTEAAAGMSACNLEISVLCACAAVE